MTTNGLKPGRFKVVEFGFLVDKDDPQADLEMQQLPGKAKRALMYWQSERGATMEDIVAYEDSIHEDDASVPLRLVDGSDE